MNLHILINRGRALLVIMRGPLSERCVTYSAKMAVMYGKTTHTGRLRKLGTGLGLLIFGYFAYEISKFK